MGNQVVLCIEHCIISSLYDSKKLLAIFLAVFFGTWVKLYFLMKWADCQIGKDLKNKFGFKDRELKEIFKCEDEDAKTGNQDKTNCPKQWERVTYNLDRINLSISSEYSFAETRTGWLNTANAFLMSGFVTISNVSPEQDNIQVSLLLGIPVIAAVSTFSISVAVFLSHAFVKKLKKERSTLEKYSESTYSIPILGLEATTPSHEIGHMGTRILSSMMFVVWIVLAILAYKQMQTSPVEKTSVILECCPITPTIQTTLPEDIKLNHIGDSKEFVPGKYLYENNIELTGKNFNDYIKSKDQSKLFLITHNLQPS